ncbi:chemotaxis protein CheR [Thermodesulfomicrobium sp. WS]|uniref:chemotaxis protein CheB n=1 Tax=Thermodesulfomicrobium sp. WS TaxID=3004129 RepID=UPI00248FC25C|nr:chemotaxis protein CheB [Thermodesulfomicrobium sp. WS]BDV01071.1 chemotaxis protein CheR [Thermodesulfomicrobium sp. WS]
MATPSYYVGIGASAGGLEAIEHFFRTMPRHSGLAFIIVQHLSPDYKSLMVELLSKKTTIPVYRAEDGMEVEADTIYLIPPKKNLYIFHGRLVLNEQETTRGINLPIDIFLRSLAEDQGEKAIAVILSGTGSDGMRGVRAVKEHGGMVMVQDESTAKFDGMPKAAISTGLVDFILPPEDMAAQLLAFVRREPLLVESGHEDGSEKHGITKLFALLKNRTKVDFSYYKPSTVNRRIERRMMVTRTTSLKEYIEYVQSHPAEIDVLYKELLIGVTSFFRDPEAFEYLAQECLPALFQSITDREVRFWVAGCSSGEEAYSLAILARECMDATGEHKPVKIFATDLDQKAIQVAAAGVYPESIAADVSPGLLGKYFHKNGDSFQVARSVREMVVFARHNLISDPPFTKIDLISCRNLLIYLQPAIQHKVFEHFNFSLNAGGILFLGSSETVGDAAGYFEPVHHKFKIFRSVGKQSPAKGTDFKPLSAPLPGGLNYAPYFQMRQGLGSADERVLERFLLGIEGDVLPLSVIVTEGLEVVHIFGDASSVFRIPSGRLSMELSSLARKDLSVLLTSLVQKAFRSGEQQETTVMVGEGDAREAMTIRVRLLPQRKGYSNLAALLFLPAASVQHEGSPVVYDLSKESEERIRDLEAELQLTRENLQATIEELETSNEELQATNEELLASNEELQSTNEELQSTNEELHTVNSEYQNKIYELMALHHDIDNILSATGIGILLVDENKAIRRFSPPITRIFSILDQDLGRPFTHITHSLEDVSLAALVDEVMTTQKPVAREVRVRGTAQVYHMQISPYSVGPSDFAGVVLSFWDVTASVRMRQELSVLEHRLREAMRLARLGFWVGHGVGLDQYWDEETFAVFGLPPKNAMTLTEIVDLFDAEYRPLVHDALFRLGKERTPVDMIARLRADLGPKWIRILGRWEEDPKGPEVRGVYQDITHVQELRERLAVLERGQGRGHESVYRYFFDTLAHGAVIQDAHGRIVDANPAAEAILGRSLAAMQGRTSEDDEWRAIREDGTPFPGAEHPAMVALREGREVLDVSMGVWRPSDQRWVWIRINSYPVFCDGESRPCRVFTVFEEVRPQETAGAASREQR